MPCLISKMILGKSPDHFAAYLNVGISQTHRRKPTRAHNWQVHRQLRRHFLGIARVLGLGSTDLWNILPTGIAIVNNVEIFPGRLQALVDDQCGKIRAWSRVVILRHRWQEHPLLSNWLGYKNNMFHNILQLIVKLLFFINNVIAESCNGSCNRCVLQLLNPAESCDCRILQLIIPKQLNSCKKWTLVDSRQSTRTPSNTHRMANGPRKTWYGLCTALCNLICLHSLCILLTYTTWYDIHMASMHLISHACSLRLFYGTSTRPCIVFIHLYIPLYCGYTAWCDKMLHWYDALQPLYHFIYHYITGSYLYTISFGLASPSNAIIQSSHWLM